MVAILNTHDVFARNSLESCLIAMTKHQESIMQTNDETLERLILSITTINRAYWNWYAFECQLFS